MKKSQRVENLLPGGIPKWIRVYDNGGESYDRYTVIYSHSQSFGNRGWVPYVGMSANPFHPQGFGQHGEYRTVDLVEGMKPGQWPPKIGRKGNLGTRIRFEDLPADCQRLVMQDYCDYWSLKIDCEMCGGKHIPSVDCCGNLKEKED
jgi:hypothetical protein